MKGVWYVTGWMIALMGSGCSEKPVQPSESESSPPSIEIAAEPEMEAAPSKATARLVHESPPKNAAEGGLPPGHPPMLGNMPAGHPPIGQAPPRGGSAPFMAATPGPTDGNALPLETGKYSTAEDMKMGLEKLENAEAKAAFEMGFRKTFTSDRSKRDYNGAETLLLEVLKTDEKHPQALRALGYVAVNQGFNFEKAMGYYKQSVEADDTYAAGHYALAFMYARGDRTIGAEHFRKAMALGMPDARGIGARFYPAAALEKANTPPQTP